VIRPAGIFDPAAEFNLHACWMQAWRFANVQGRAVMLIVRREFLRGCGVAAAIPSMIGFTAAQAPGGGPRLKQILRKDLQGQGETVQETVVNAAEFPPGSAAPWHMHPGAQELLHVQEGSLIVEIEGDPPTLLKEGDAGIIPAERVHLARNPDLNAPARALVVHSRAAKDKPLVLLITR
jgi:quercetin dioxygenase-like cupin family protein